MPNKLILDSHWERSGDHVTVEPHILSGYLRQAGFRKMPDSLELISSGLANTNYKISFSDYQDPFFLRLWTRDPAACMKEVHLLKQLAELPLPLSQCIHAEEDPERSLSWAVQTWLPGKPMTTVLQECHSSDIFPLYTEAASYIPLISSISFNHAGFINPDLSIRPFRGNEPFDYLVFLLHDPRVQELLGSRYTRSLHDLIQKHEALIKECIEHTNLVHADYKPANFLVSQNETGYFLSGIVDWEFALSYDWHFDAGMLLRFENEIGEKLKPALEAGLKSSGLYPDEHWYIRAKLLDFTNLLSFMNRDPHNYSNVIRHCTELVLWSIQRLSNI
jgi:aminoglycoside phosphotransferase (APT) family kinase protein